MFVVLCLLLFLLFFLLFIFMFINFFSNLSVKFPLYQELRLLLELEQNPICYDGFEPSGRMHIAQGILKAINVNRLTKSGCIFVFWVADWFAMLNNKMNGDLEKV